MADIIDIPINHLYQLYKPDREKIYKKYYRHNGNPLLWTNSPMSLFVEKYQKIGSEILNQLDNDPFIKMEYEIYHDAETVINDTHKFNTAKRIIKVVKSIRKVGYAQGKFNKSKHLIIAKRGFESPFGSDPDGFTLVSRKHRTAACVGLGYEFIKARVK